MENKNGLTTIISLPIPETIFLFIKATNTNKTIERKITNNVSPLNLNLINRAFGVKTNSIYPIVSCRNI